MGQFMLVKAGRDLHAGKPGTAFARSPLSLCVYDGGKGVSFASILTYMYEYFSPVGTRYPLSRSVEIRTESRGTKRRTF